MKICIITVVTLLLFSACTEGRQQRSFVNELTSDDSLTIGMGDWNLTKYHSDKLAMDIYYPSFLVRQELSADNGLQELFMWQDVSISVMIDSLSGMMRSAGQQMMSMGAELVEVGDDYSIHEGQDEQWEYYGKVIDSDSLRQVTVVLRFNPDNVEAVEPLKEWVREFDGR